MCLTIDQRAKLEITDKDIVCYKIIQKPSRYRNYRTFFRNMTIKLGETYTSSIVRSFDWQGLDCIENGLHSFAEMQDIFKDFPRDTPFDNRTYIVKCTIPKGSYYYKGEFRNISSYASDKLRYDKIVYTWIIH